MRSMQMRIIAMALLCVACDARRPTNTPLAEYDNGPPAVPSVAPQQTRFRVSRVGAFDDNTAYWGVRSIFVIVDTKTGIEYVGISGVGISETGDHQVGKVRQQDER